MSIEMDQDRIVSEATYAAATAFHFDASEESQRQGNLHITFMYLHQFRTLPAGGTHQCLVVINDVWASVTRTETGEYAVEPERSNAATQTELNIREQVLRAAVEYLYPGPATDDIEAKLTMLIETNEDHTFTIMECPPIGDDVLRAWEVQFLPLTVCVVGMLPSHKGYIFRTIWSIEASRSIG